ncbi:acetyltransferase, partial [Vibrio cholerae]
MILVIKVVRGSIVLRCSPLKRALCVFLKNFHSSAL